MIIETRHDLVKLEGALDKNLWPTIQAAVNLLLRQHQQGIIIECSGLTHCSPEGVKTFRDAMDYIEHYHARIVVCGLSDEIMETIRAIPGIRSRLPIAANIQEARASLDLGRHTHGRQDSAKNRPLTIILVPLLGGDVVATTTSLSCRLAKTEKGIVHLVYVLEVPRHLPVNAPLPEEEEIAAAVLKAAETAVRREGVTVISHVTRARDTAEEILHQAELLSADTVVLSYIASTDPSDNTLDKVTRTVLERAPCDVILNKVRAERV